MVLNWCEKEEKKNNMKKIKQFSEAHKIISKTT